MPVTVCHRDAQGCSTHLRFTPSVSVVTFLVTAMRARCQFLRARSSFLQLPGFCWCGACQSLSEEECPRQDGRGVAMHSSGSSAAQAHCSVAHSALQPWPHMHTGELIAMSAVLLAVPLPMYRAGDMERCIDKAAYHLSDSDRLL